MGGQSQWNIGSSAPETGILEKNRKPVDSRILSLLLILLRYEQASATMKLPPPHLPHYDGLYPPNMSQNKLLLSQLLYISNQPQSKQQDVCL